MSVFGGNPDPDIEAKSKYFVRRTKLIVQALSVASIGSATITVPILMSEETNANRLGSPFNGRTVNSIGSLGFWGSPHCSGFLPAHIKMPSFPTEMPRSTNEGFSAFGGQFRAWNRVSGGTPFTKM